jgi:hypothetical protein
MQPRPRPTTTTSVPKPIANHRRVRQAVVFENLSIGATDLDGIIEYQELCYVLFELKYKDAPLPEGQRLALVRLCDDLTRAKPTLLIVASHDTPPGQDIDAASAVVSKYRYRRRWYEPRSPITVKDLADRFLTSVAGFSQAQT